MLISSIIRPLNPGVELNTGPGVGGVDQERSRLHRRQRQGRITDWSNLQDVGRTQGSAVEAYVVDGRVAKVHPGLAKAYPLQKKRSEAAESLGCLSEGNLRVTVGDRISTLVRKAEMREIRTSGLMSGIWQGSS
jgi:hypothetical protein